jgi:hypothetical protein
VIPVGSLREQRLLVVERHGSEWQERSDGPCVFVPLVGAAGWEAPAALRGLGRESRGCTRAARPMSSSRRTPTMPRCPVADSSRASGSSARTSPS